MSQLSLFLKGLETNKPMTQALQDFFLYLASEKGLSENTIIAYLRDVSTFLRYLLKSEEFKTWDAIESQRIVIFLSQKKQAGHASSSVARNLIALKVFFKFLKREGKVKKNVTHALGFPKLWQLIPEVLTLTEVEAILAQPDTSTKRGARDKAILELLYSSGLRVSELCELKLHNVSETFVRVMGKGGKERLVPLGKLASKAIDDYLCYREGTESEAKTTPLFVGNKGHSLRRTTVWALVKYYAKRTRITKNVFPHTFRHSFATHLFENGADLRIIQEMLGHANISSTERYSHIGQTHVRKSFEAFTPPRDSKGFSKSTLSET